MSYVWTFKNIMGDKLIETIYDQCFYGSMDQSNLDKISVSSRIKQWFLASFTHTLFFQYQCVNINGL